MKKLFKISLVLLALSLLPMGLMAADTEHADVQLFGSIAGVVTAIEPVYQDGEPVHNRQRISLEGAAGNFVFYTDYFTYVLGEPVAVGDEVTGHYSTDAPMPLIYPPQYNVQLIVNGAFNNVHLDRFSLDSTMGTILSANNMLLVHIGEDTEVLLQDGQEFQYFGESLLHDLDGRKLVVVYDISTRSIPAITTANQIIVLFERAVALPEPIELNDVNDIANDELDYNEPTLEFNNHGISVNDAILESHTWIQIGEEFYVPFRVVVDALGHGDTIAWDGETSTITANNGEQNISFTIGLLDVQVNGETIALSAPPVIIGNHTFVPFSFFSQAFGQANAYIHAGQVFINNFEAME